MTSIDSGTSTLTTDEHIRAAFPALQSETVFLENAGGSQVPAVVADRIREYMLGSYVQLGAPYELSRQATARVEEAHTFANLLMNGADRGHAIIGPSSTALCNMLAECYGRALEPGDEIVVAQTGHETNVGPWVRLERSGMRVRWWPVDREAQNCRIEDLQPLLGPRTRLVALPHVSNLLGEIVDVARVAELAHAAGARVVVDGVAFAPHRAIDVAAWNADWYFYSAYKVYGPHMACLFGTHEALGELEGPNHFFVPRDEVPYKFESGGVNHEACAGLLALGEYLTYLTGARECSRAVIEEAFAIMEAREAPLAARLVDFLATRPGVRIVGPAHAEASRVGTISFVHESSSSRAIATEVTARQIGIRYGHMYAYRLCQGLGLDPEDGVVRISLVHYNTMQEIDRLIEVLETVI
ncbi:MAG: cysteine desulfurase-like protein [Planctomycetota bacterium]|jgi:cysteine desulfurase family protein (TIGR01976 family)